MPSVNLPYSQPSYPEEKPSETFSIAVPKIRIVFEMENGMKRIPVLLLKMSAEANVHDWTKQMHMKCKLFDFEI